MKRSFLYAFLSITIACLYTCTKDDLGPEDFIIAQSNDKTVFAEVAINALSNKDDFTSNDYEHYFVSVFQAMYPFEPDDTYVKSIAGKTIATPPVESFSVNGTDIPMRDGNAYNYTFAPEDGSVISDPPSVSLGIDQQKDIPFQLEIDAKTIKGFFPAVADDGNPQLISSTSNINKNGGDIFTWTPDPNNVLGVVLMIYESPASGPNSVVKYIHVDDDGAHTFTAADLEGLKLNKAMRISFIRGNYGINEDKILLGSLKLLHSQSEYFITE